MAKKTRKKLQDAEVFDAALREEILVSSEFVLPISVLSLQIEGGWSDKATRTALDALRVADLPNTTTGDARVVEERLCEAVPDAAVGVAPFASGDTVKGLIERARVSGGV